MKKSIILFLFFIAVSNQLKAIMFQAFSEPRYNKNNQSEYITNPNQPDGFGSQFYNIIATAIYSELVNKKFIYTPFKTMEHNYSNEQGFLEKKEWLINFKDNFEVTDKKDIPYANWGSVIFNTEPWANSIILKKIKTIFRENKDIDNYFRNNNFNIAVHIRRPNLHDSEHPLNSYIYTPNNIFVNIINNLRATYLDKNPLFHIYSQGELKNFTEFNAPDVIFHLNESIEDTFISMVVADVLVVSRSALSYSAAMLSDGIIYYLRFGFRPLPHWINID